MPVTVAQDKPNYDRGNQYDKVSPFQHDLIYYQQLLQIRLQLDHIAREVSENLCPTRPRWLLQSNDLSNDRGPHNDMILDSTAPQALRTAEAGFLAGVTSPAAPWIEYGVDDDTIGQQPQAKAFLDFKPFQ